MSFQCARFSSEPEIVRAAADSPALREGARGDGVVALQLALIDLGFGLPVSTHAGKTLPDGIFGSETARAVTAFQRANGLTPDGVAGTHTLARMDQLLAAQSEATARADPLNGVKSRGF
jgi:peptidoglycan hydrolase-like protein with peptidoglycan-binding domain